MLTKKWKKSEKTIQSIRYSVLRYQPTLPKGLIITKVQQYDLEMRCYISEYKQKKMCRLGGQQIQ